MLIPTNEFNVGFKDLLKIDYSKGRIRDNKWVLDKVYFTINTMTNFFVS